MSVNWVNDINEMQRKYGVHDWMRHATPFQLKKYLEFRLDFIKEEYDETKEAIIMHDVEEIVDGLIDMCVVAIGTLDAMGVDAHRAWNEVLTANMAKEVGVKESRPNPLGIPDLIKPEGWTAPVHFPNHGFMPSAFEDDSGVDKAVEELAGKTLGEHILDMEGANLDGIINYNEERMDIIGQNGNDGLHYTPGPGPLDGKDAKTLFDKAMYANAKRTELLAKNPEINSEWHPIDFTKDSEYVRLYGKGTDKDDTES